MIMNITTLTSVFEAIAAKIAENKDYLVELDQQNGDGDLGISMNDGYGSTATRQDLPVARYPPSVVLKTKQCTLKLCILHARFQKIRSFV